MSLGRESWRSTARWATLALALGMGAVALSGCVDPEGRYDEFVERSASGVGGAAGAGGSGGLGPCELPAAEELNGDFLLALSTTLSPEQPVMFFAESVAEERADGLYVTINAFPLSAADRKTRVGEAVPPTTEKIEAGELIIDLPNTIVPGEANPILVGVEMEASTTLTARLCSVRTPEEPDKVLDFFCGDVTGNATLPVSLDLVGSTFAATRITDPDNYPEVVINCAGDPAEAL